MEADFKIQEEKGLTEEKLKKDREKAEKKEEEMQKRTSIFCIN